MLLEDASLPGTMGKMQLDRRRKGGRMLVRPPTGRNRGHEGIMLPKNEVEFLVDGSVRLYPILLSTKNQQQIDQNGHIINAARCRVVLKLYGTVSCKHPGASAGASFLAPLQPCRAILSTRVLAQTSPGSLRQSFGF